MVKIGSNRLPTMRPRLTARALAGALAHPFQVCHNCRAHSPKHPFRLSASQAGVSDIGMDAFTHAPCKPQPTHSTRFVHMHDTTTARSSAYDTLPPNITSKSHRPTCNSAKSTTSPPTHSSPSTHCSHCAHASCPTVGSSSPPPTFPTTRWT